MRNEAAAQERRSFYGKVVSLVIPMALQNLINVGVSATDVIMLGKVGETALSGASLGGQVMFILNMLLFGMTSGACVLTAQYWGKKDTQAIEKILAIVLKTGGVCSVLLMAVTLAVPERVMLLFTSDRAVIAEGSRYLRLVAFTYPLTALTMSYLNICKSVERVVVSTVVYASSLVLNFCVNAVLIFGLFGAPRLGIAGAGIGTLCARALETAIVLAYQKTNKDIKIRFTYILHLDRILLKDFLHYSGPVILNELLWGVGYSMNAAIIGHLGSSAVAANSISHVCRQLAQVVVFGIGNATAIMLGKAIGEGKKKLAEIYAGRFIRLSLIGGLLGGGLIFLLRPLAVSGLGFTGQTAVYLKVFLGVMSYYVAAQALNTTCIVGIFRSGGDTRFGMVLDMTTMWFGSIALGAAAAFLLHWPVEAVYVILLGDELIKLPFSFWRFRQKRWLRDVTR